MATSDFITLPGTEGQTYYVRAYDIGVMRTELDTAGTMVMLTTFEGTPTTLLTKLTPAEIFATLEKWEAERPQITWATDPTV